MARELYDAIDRVTRALAEAVMLRYDSADENAKNVAQTSITLPDRVFDYLQREMAFVMDEWAPNTKFEPLTGKMMFNGIAIRSDE
jgi:hypothetical protein